MMKKRVRLLISLALLLLLSACGKESARPEGKNGIAETGSMEHAAGQTDAMAGMDFDRSFLYQHGWFCATEDTVYFAENQLIYYYDKASGIVAPLCGKPECSHDGADCNAYCGSIILGLYNYNGRLYWVSPRQGYLNWGLYSCAYDGTDRQMVRELDKEILGDSFGISYLCYHRGWLYWSCKETVVVDSKIENQVRFFAFPFDPDEGGRMIFKGTPSTFVNGKLLYVTLQPYQDGVYLIVNREEEIESQYHYYLTIYKWDIEEQELAVLYDDESGFYCNGRVWVEEDGILLCGTSKILNKAETKEEPVVYEYQHHCYRYNFSDGQIERLYELSPIISKPLPHAVRDGLIISSEGSEGSITHIIRDFDGNIIQQTVVKEEEWFAPIASMADILAIEVLGRDDNNVYCYYVGPGTPRYIVAIPLDGSGVKLMWKGENWL